MDLIRLDRTTFLPNGYVEDYSSLVWSEREVESGDFELKTRNVQQVMSYLPEDSFVSLVDTQEVMVVETHEIKNDEDGNPELTVKGRSLEAFVLENRSLHDPNLSDPTNLYGAPKSFLDYFGNRVTSAPGSTGNPYSVRDEIANFGFVAEYSSSGLPDVYTTVKRYSPDNLYDWSKDYLRKYRMGIRSHRPTNPGVICAIRVYYRKNYDALVKLDWDKGDIVNASYFFSKKNLKTVAYVYSPIGFRVVYAPGYSSALSGLDRRVLWVNATDLTTAGDDTVANALIKRGELELAKHQRETLFDCEISPQIDFKVRSNGTGLPIGSIITVNAEYGLSQRMVITENIRTQDAQGEREYPTLSRLED